MEELSLLFVRDHLTDFAVRRLAFHARDDFPRELANLDRNGNVFVISCKQVANAPRSPH